MKQLSYQRKRQLLFIGFVLFIIFLLVMGTVAIVQNSTKNPYGEAISISNYDKKITKLPDEYKQLFNSMLHDIVERNYSGSKNINSINDAVIRDASDKVEVSTKERQAGSFIVDISSIKQSYLVQYEYTSNPTDNFTSGYPLLISCLDKEKLIYGDFDCKEVYSQGFQEIDPVINLLPHESLNYKIQADVDNNNKTAIAVTIYLSMADRSDEEKSVAKYKAQALDWLLSQKIVPSKYTISYTTSNL